MRGRQGRAGLRRRRRSPNLERRYNQQQQQQYEGPATPEGPGKIYYLLGGGARLAGGLVPRFILQVEERLSTAKLHLSDE